MYVRDMEPGVSNMSGHDTELVGSRVYGHDTDMVGSRVYGHDTELRDSRVYGHCMELGAPLWLYGCDMEHRGVQCGCMDVIWNWGLQGVWT